MNAAQLVENYRIIRHRLMAQKDIRPVVIRLDWRKIYTEPIGPKIPKWELQRRAVLEERKAKNEMKLSLAALPFAMPSSPVAVRKIVTEVCEKHGLTKEEMCSDQRARPIVAARQEVFYRLKKETTWSLPRIGRLIGGKDHTTVMHGVRKHAAKHGLPL